MKSGTSEVTGTSNVSLFIIVFVLSCYIVSEHTRDLGKKVIHEICHDKLLNKTRFLFSLAQHYYYELVKVAFCCLFSLTTCFDSTKESSSGCCLT
jgi:hypothetical protein